jgi:hypothetical protein
MKREERFMPPRRITKADRTVHDPTSQFPIRRINPVIKNATTTATGINMIHLTILNTDVCIPFHLCSSAATRAYFLRGSRLSSGKGEDGKEDCQAPTALLPFAISRSESLWPELLVKATVSSSRPVRIVVAAARIPIISRSLLSWIISLLDRTHRPFEASFL